MQISFDTIVIQLSMIVVSAAIIGTAFLYARQPIILAYIVAGILIGPSGFDLIPNANNIEQIAHVGVILLLFLLGLHLQPRKLLLLFQKTALITLGTSLLFFSASFVFALSMGMPLKEALVIGAALMFSSTVIGLKLIPTTALHHKHIGEVMTSVLLLQDILAIMVILFLNIDAGEAMLTTFAMLLVKLVGIAILAFAGVRFIVLPLFRRFDVIQEYTFVATLAWCLFWAEAAHQLGLSYEIGAFLAGLSIAVSQVAMAIAEHLKPLREFFLILFFFAIGAQFDAGMAPFLMLSGFCFGVVLVGLKVLSFKKAFIWTGEDRAISQQLGVRLGQASEFSMLVAFSALSSGVLSSEGATLIQSATIATFIFSTYWVVKRYPTPISTKPKLRRD
ncbi:MULTISPECIES: cation:proton antiporter [Corallincola]|uniref:Cation:proton antiporter n=3 Tax=Corallincola TaxID=1775176 RepID=A0A368NNC2_9GAMM|nr:MULTISPECIES: cation:proton antiporter [Corallincola]RCU51908.1 cation:proton antiporter [Corallincola holothuriorum]TAA47399.1 cation:proton antiporter [Corallincola spongiicola]TCI05072.1 cation:proton antiporter [Corallincola luteus]